MPKLKTGTIFPTEEEDNQINIGAVVQWFRIIALQAIDEGSIPSGSI